MAAPWTHLVKALGSPRKWETQFCREWIVNSSDMNCHFRLSVSLALVLCLSMASCGRPRPLLKTKIRGNGGPWCAPNQRVQIGQRVVGHVHDGDKWKIFLMDDKGKEYDPDKLAEQTWSYLERTGDAKRIKDACSKAGHYVSLSIVALKPIVVILEMRREDDPRKQLSGSLPRSNWVAQVSVLRDPPYREDLEWFSPDLKQKPTPLSFSAEGVAEIALSDGRLKLIRNGQEFQTARE
jgi:hypothetical protein